MFELPATGRRGTIQNINGRNAIAVAHGNAISLFDVSSLMQIGQLKTVDEVRVLSKHGSYLVSGGKGTQNNGALTIWDPKMNK